MDYINELINNHRELFTVITLILLPIIAFVFYRDEYKKHKNVFNSLLSLLSGLLFAINFIFLYNDTLLIYSAPVISMFIIIRIIIWKRRMRTIIPTEFDELNDTVNSKYVNPIENTYSEAFSYLYLGEYPQTIACAKALAEMSDKVDDRGYYISSYDNARYEKVIANPFMYEVDNKFSNDNIIVEHCEYYFKVEPIKWIILEESEGKAVILADLIIDNHRFNNEESNSNSWEKSEIRQWLNSEFYNKAFNAKQKILIENTLVDNSPVTGHYICPLKYTLIEQENTNDKVFLLSYEESIRYGCDDNQVEYVAIRKALTSDYARAKGILAESDTPYGIGIWWLRSPGELIDSVSIVSSSGILCEGDYIYLDFVGVRPALIISYNSKE